MKYFSFIALSIALISLSVASCERHSFEETKRLHLEHESHDEATEAKAENEKEPSKEVAPAAEKKAAESAPETKEEPRKTGI